MAQPPKRPNYFQSQFLVVRDFQDEQAYHEELLRRHNRYLHEWGVIGDGLQVSKSADNKNLSVSPGSAIDGLGREIVLSAPGSLKIDDVRALVQPGGTAQDIYITIAFQESDSDNPDDKYPPPNGTVNVTRKIQTPVIGAKQALQNDGALVILARVRVPADAAGEVGPPDNSVRKFASSLIARGSNLGDISLDGALSFTTKEKPSYPQMGLDYDAGSDALRIRARTKDAPVLDTPHLTIKRDTGNVSLGTPSLPASKEARLSIFAGAYEGTLIDCAIAQYHLTLRYKSLEPNRVSYMFDLVNNNDERFDNFLAFDKGNVGIGTTSPAAHLEISNPWGDWIFLRQQRGTGGGGGFHIHNPWGDIVGNESNRLEIGYRTATGVENWGQLVIHGPTGNVGIGQQVPAQKLHITGGNILHEWSATSGQQYGVLTSPDQFHVCENAYFDGHWKAIKRGKSSVVSTFVGNGNALSVLVDNTEREKDAVRELALAFCVRMDGNVGIGTADPKAKLDVSGAANIWSGERHAVKQGYMAAGSLTIGNINANFGGGTGWNNNSAALLLETLDNTEIAVHDAGKRLASLMYYEGGDVNRITIGRQMGPGWGAIKTLALNGNVGIGTNDPTDATLQIAQPASTTDRRDLVELQHIANNTFLMSGFGWQHGVSPSTTQLGAWNGEQNISIVTDDRANLLAGGSAKGIFIKTGGIVGIGTVTPQAKLHVIGSIYSSSGAGWTWGPNGNWGGSPTNLSILASESVGAANFRALSDTRIKEIAGRSDSATDLKTLLSIEVTDYRHKDVMGKGNGTYKKVIGQQVEKVFPQAVSKHTDVVPDIYEQASIRDGWISLTTDLKRGERVKLLREQGGEGVYEVLDVTEDKFRVAFKHEGDKVFVFGREVNDFLTVDYDAIAMLNVSATQQLKKDMDEELKALRAESAQLKAANDSLTKRLQLLESKLEAVPNLAATTKGSNGNGSHG